MERAMAKPVPRACGVGDRLVRGCVEEMGEAVEGEMAERRMERRSG